MFCKSILNWKKIYSHSQISKVKVRNFPLLRGRMIWNGLSVETEVCPNLAHWLGPTICVWLGAHTFLSDCGRSLQNSSMWTQLFKRYKNAAFQMKKLLHLVIHRESLRGEVDGITSRSDVFNFWINGSVFFKCYKIRKY